MDGGLEDDHLEHAARRIIEHHGAHAVDVAARRAGDLARRGDWRGQDVAMLVLTRVEQLTGRQPAAACRGVM